MGILVMEQKVYVTSDGKEFYSMFHAQNHENNIRPNNKEDILSHIMKKQYTPLTAYGCGVYIINDLEELNMIIEEMKKRNITISSCVKNSWNNQWPKMYIEKANKFFEYPASEIYELEKIYDKEIIRF